MPKLFKSVGYWTLGLVILGGFIAMAVFADNDGRASQNGDENFDQDPPVAQSVDVERQLLLLESRVEVLERLLDTPSSIGELYDLFRRLEKLDGSFGMVGYLEARVAQLEWCAATDYLYC